MCFPHNIVSKTLSFVHTEVTFLSTVTPSIPAIRSAVSVPARSLVASLVSFPSAIFSSSNANLSLPPSLSSFCLLWATYTRQSYLQTHLSNAKAHKLISLAEAAEAVGVSCTNALCYRSAGGWEGISHTVLRICDEVFGWRGRGNDKEWGWGEWSSLDALQQTETKEREEKCIRLRLSGSV